MARLLQRGRHTCRIQPALSIQLRHGAVTGDGVPQVLQNKPLRHPATLSQNGRQPLAYTAAAHAVLQH